VIYRLAAAGETSLEISSYRRGESLLQRCRWRQEAGPDDLVAVDSEVRRYVELDLEKEASIALEFERRQYTPYEMQGFGLHRDTNLLPELAYGRVRRFFAAPQAAGRQRIPASVRVADHKKLTTVPHAYEDALPFRSEYVPSGENNSVSYAKPEPPQPIDGRGSGN
jgi:hypothetical protein